MLSYPHWCKEVISNNSNSILKDNNNNNGNNNNNTSNDGTIAWTPMWKYDSDMLEYENNSKKKQVYVENRREVVNIEQRQLSSCYDSNTPIRRVIRGTWFYYHSSTKSYFPFNEEVANRIEIWFQGLKLLTPTNGDPIRADVEISLALSHKRNPELTKYKITAIKEVVTSSITTTGTTSVTSLPLPPLPPLESKTNDLLIDGFSITMKSMAFNDIFNGTIQLTRGIRVTPDPEEAWCGTEVDHLIFVVHGIGQTMFAKSDLSFKNNIASLRKLTMEQQEVLFQQEFEQYNDNLNTNSNFINNNNNNNNNNTNNNNNDNNNVSTPSSILTNYGNKKRIEYIPIEWYDALRTNETSLSHDLSLVTLPNLQVVRQIANEVVLDILLYLTPEFREKILTYVCSKIIQMYTTFIEINPTFILNQGKCSLIGHSLGTVILFDLLSNQRRESIIGNSLSLPFRPHSFVALGSPLGLFLSIRNNAHTLRFGEKHNDNNSKKLNSPVNNSIIEDAVISQCFVFPTCSTFFNIFHPHDPVAYRIEPLLDPALSSKGPVIVVHHKGGLRPHYIIKNVATQISDAVNMVLNPGSWFTSTLSASSSSSLSLSSNSSLLSTTNQSKNSSILSTSPLNSSLLTSSSSSSSSQTPFNTNSNQGTDECPIEIPHVALNGGRRVDFMLQETGLENANEYISSITSHTGYFDMKDVARFIVVNIW